jgi:tetratricopeptide (TPR) repeat protein
VTAQIAEALRLYAMYPPVEETSKHHHVRECIQLSIKFFDKAVAETEGKDAWVLAHRGAAYSFKHWMRGILAHDTPSAAGAGERAWSDVRDASLFEDVAAAAEQDFDRAFALNPMYGWSMAFKALLHTLKGEYEKAASALQKALVRDIHGQLLVHRALCELSSYSSQKERWAEAVRLGWEALRLDTEDVYALYHIAACLGRLDDRNAPVARSMARTRLRGVRNHIDMMLIGLDIIEEGAEGRTWKTRLAELQKHIDMETIAMIQHDPTWNQVRGTQEYSALMRSIIDWLQ